MVTKDESDTSVISEEGGGGGDPYVVRVTRNKT